MIRTFFSSVYGYFYNKPCYTFTEHEKYNKVLKELKAQKKTPEIKKISKAARIIHVPIRPVKKYKFIKNTSIRRKYHLKPRHVKKKIRKPIRQQVFYLHQPQKFKN